MATQFMQDFFMDFLVNGGAIDYASKSFELLCRKNNLNKKAATKQLTDCLLFTKENGFLVSVYGVVLMAEIDSKFYITHDHKRFYTWCEKYGLKPSVMRFTRID
ncbi:MULTISPECIES: hypothetical protein [Cobetia]|uniref:hypothetical protein n=1 Tax=Cobetia TaxID=204286 RepID=UPI0011157051|nr:MULTISPECIES: hypothetical protein [Cobetia]